jgi:2-polyprenyl-3-methyl-5-hydroxy-6-metoxy-1,4-benzoquinol methylase
MPFDLKHWNNPRASIATKYMDNDFAYVTRGANTALYVLEQFDLKPSEAKQLTILDYGCGTGRASFFLSRIFGKVIGYDPNKYCIAEAYKENEKADVQQSNLYFTSEIREIPQCDLAVSVNVIEHLVQSEAQIMVNVLSIKNKGHTLLWYSPIGNTILEPYLISGSWEDKLKSAHGGGRVQIDMFDFTQRK